MNFQKIARIILLGLLSIAFTSVAAAQVSQPTPQMQIQTAPKRPMAVAVGNNLHCAGYIQSGAINTGNKIVGGHNEADQFTYAENDYVYINMGRNKGVNVGDTFAVVRPRGQVHSKWTKKNDIGFFVEEVGTLEVVNVKQDASVARINFSCSTFLLGDLVQLTEKRVSPMKASRQTLNRFGDASGKATGRLLMSRDGAEALARDFIAYVDLGADNNVRIGDVLTIFRPLGDGNLTKKPDHESVTSRDYGFQSEAYAGGKFSNQAARKSGDRATGSEVTTAEAKEGRPAWLRKVVGEAVVLNVKEKTATVVITLTGQEIHPGDWVEIQ